MIDEENIEKDTELTSRTSKSVTQADSVVGEQTKPQVATKTTDNPEDPESSDPFYQDQANENLDKSSSDFGSDDSSESKNLISNFFLDLQES